MNDIIEQKWLDVINYEYNKDKKYNDLTKEIIKLIKVAPIRPQTIAGEEFSYAQIVNINKILMTYNIPNHYIAYIDGEENGPKTEFTHNDVIYYVIDDSTEIVELMIDEYYACYVYLIPKRYLELDDQNYYKITNYKKLIVISKKPDRNYKRPTTNDFMKLVHKFMFDKIILEKK